MLYLPNILASSSSGSTISSSISSSDSYFFFFLDADFNPGDLLELFVTGLSVYTTGSSFLGFSNSYSFNLAVLFASSTAFLAFSKVILLIFFQCMQYS